MLDLDNKTLLVSIRRIDNEGQEEFDTFFADVKYYNENNVRVVRRNGEEMSLPYDEDVYVEAEPGFYELKNADIQDNPDFIAQWTVFVSEAAAVKYRHLNV